MLGPKTMEDKQEKQDKPEKKVEPPPKMIDPKLAKTVEFKGETT